MANEIKVTHLGYDCIFREDADKWSCHALDMEHASLAKLKKQINAYDLEARRVDLLPAVVVGNHSWEKPRKVTITSIDDDKQVWVKTTDAGKRGSWEKERSKESVGRLAKDEPVTYAKLKEAMALNKKASELSKQAEEVIASIPRWTIEELREAAEQRQEAKASGE